MLNTLIFSSLIFCNSFSQLNRVVQVTIVVVAVPEGLPLAVTLTWVHVASLFHCTMQDVAKN